MSCESKKKAPEITRGFYFFIQFYFSKFGKLLCHA